MNTNIALKGLYALVLGIVGVSLTACPGNPVGNGISGQLTAPVNQTLNGVSVVACFNRDCASNNSKEVVVNGGHTATYQLAGLTPGQYVIIALKDVNGSGKLDVGDWIGTYGPIGNATPVTSPASNINVEMGVVTAVNGLRQKLGLEPEKLESLIQHDAP